MQERFECLQKAQSMRQLPKPRAGDARHITVRV
jgi:hypothetical protein